MSSTIPNTSSTAKYGWYLQSDDNVQTGPHTWDEVLVLARAGKVDSGYSISHLEKTKGRWIPITESNVICNILAESEPPKDLVQQSTTAGPDYRIETMVKRKAKDYRHMAVLSLIWILWLFSIGFVGKKAFYEYTAFNRNVHLQNGLAYIYALDQQTFTENEWILRAVTAAVIFGAYTIVLAIVASFVSYAF